MLHHGVNAPGDPKSQMERTRAVIGSMAEDRAISAEQRLDIVIRLLLAAQYGTDSAQAEPVVDSRPPEFVREALDLQLTAIVLAGKREGSVPSARSVRRAVVAINAALRRARHRLVQQPGQLLRVQDETSADVRSVIFGT